MARRKVGPVSEQEVMDQELAQQLVDRARVEGGEIDWAGRPVR